jgi:lambda family phage minor tail protein L
MKEKYLKNLLSADPTTPIVLFQIEMYNQGKYFFHAGENGYRNALVFGGAPYDHYPIIGEGFDVQGDGRLPRPKMILSNHQGNVSLRLKYFDDFTSAKVTRIKTMLKYLDEINFPNQINPYGESDSESFTKDVYFVNQKVKETDEIVEFELVSALEIENAKIPCRSVYSNTCSWSYRSKEGCGYSGKPIADKKGKRFIPKGYSGPHVAEEVYFEDQYSSTQFAPTNANDVYEEWDSTKTYSSGDVVSVTTLNGDSALNPPTIYVCIGNNVESHPSKDRTNWIEDACDKSICGCRLRFSDAAEEAGGCKRFDSPYGSDGKYSESEEGLPFGGFPGVDPYEFK